MNVIVLLRAVRDPAGFTVNRRAQKVFVNRKDWIINPADKNALEAALALGGTVSAVAIGGAPADDALRQALAMGARRAVLVRDTALEQADAFVLTTVLRRLVTHLGGADLVLLGAEVLDADTAQIGPRLAEALNWPVLADVHQLRVEGTKLTAIAPAGREFHKYEAALPAVVMVARDSNKPRYAPAARVMSVYQAQDASEEVTGADLGLADIELTAVAEYRGESFPPEREPGRRFEGDLDEVARQIAEVVSRV